MKRSLVFALSILAALAVAAPSIAQTEQTASGTVVSSSPTQIVVRTSDGKQLTFMTDADTNRPADLQAGANVTVRYHDMSGTLHAASVSATSGTTTTPSTTTPSTSAPSATAPAADPTGNDARMPQQPTTPATTRVQEPATTTPPPATAAQEADPARMPATASPLPLVGLSGLLALAGGLGTRLLRRRT